MRLTHPTAGVPPPPTAGTLLAGLTPEQAQAVTHGTGPLLLIAGPGAGKTRTLTHRIAHLLESGQARPDQILAVTFSVRAAGELRLRLADLLGQERARAVTAATFHSVCARLLREHAHVFGRTEQLHDLRPGRHAPGGRLDPRPTRSAQPSRRRSPVRTAGVQPRCRRAISLAKNQLLDPGDLRELGPEPGRGGDRRGVAESRGGAARARTRGTSTTCSRSRCGCCASTRIAFSGSARGGDGCWSTSSRTSTAPRPSWSPCSPGPTATSPSSPTTIRSSTGSRGADPGHIVEFAKRYPGTRGDRAGAQLPQPRGDPRGGRRAASRTTSEGCRSRWSRSAAKAAASRSAGFYEDWHEAHWVAGQVAEAIAAGRPGAGDPHPRPHRLRHPGGAAGAGPRRDPAPGARQPRAVRALRGQGRARVPDAAGQPGRRPGVPAGDPVAPARRRDPRPPTRWLRARARSTTATCCAACAARRDSTRFAPPSARQRSARSAKGCARPPGDRSGPLARPRRARRGDARRRTRPALRAAPRHLGERGRAPGRRAGARGPALAVPRRPGVRGAARPGASLRDFLEHAAGCTPRSSAPARTAASPSRRFTGPRAPRRRW